MNTNNSQAPHLPQNAVMQSVIFQADLRIGNLFHKRLISGQGRTVTAELGYADINRIINNTGSFIYEAIKATEEELLKIGFEKVYDGNYKRYQINLLETNIYLRPSLDKWYFGFVNKGQDCEINDCYELEFIHEIQNLIFSLTRVSLTVA